MQCAVAEDITSGSATLQRNAVSGWLGLSASIEISRIDRRIHAGISVLIRSVIDLAEI
jgi:hypothetical protein